MMKKIKAAIFDWAGTTIDYGCFAPVMGFIDGFGSIGIDISEKMAREPMGLAKLDHVRAIAAMLDEAVTEEQILKVYEVFEAALFANIEGYCEVKDHVVETVAALRGQGVGIGSTTGYTPAMMEIVLPKAAAQGYAPDFCIAPGQGTSGQVVKGRPYPHMIWHNLMYFGISDPREAVKIGDTKADIEEGVNACCWTVGVILGSSELGLTRGEVAALPDQELNERKAAVRASFYAAGADYIIDDLDELPGVVDDINRSLARNASRKLLTPGPLTTRHSVKYAMRTDHCTWDEEYKAITRSVMEDLTRIAANDDYATVLLQGSGSYAVEAMLNCLCGEREKVLFLVNGEYGKRMQTIADRAGKEYAVLDFAPTQPVDVAAVERKLLEDTAISAVAFVHCETTTGVINPLEDIVYVAKAYGKKVLVDAMSSFAAYAIDMPGLAIDALAASANKCLEGMPGLAFVIAKKTLIEASKSNSASHCLDLFDQYQGLYQGGGKFRFTSPTNVLLALRQAIDEYEKEGGLPARQERYQKNHAVLVEGLEKIGVHAIVAPENQSYIITTFDLGDLDFPGLYEALKAKGFVIYPGKMTTQPTFRLGNIGNVFGADMAELVDTVREYLA